MGSFALLLLLSWSLGQGVRSGAIDLQDTKKPTFSSSPSAESQPPVWFPTPDMERSSSVDVGSNPGTVVAGAEQPAAPESSPFVTVGQNPWALRLVAGGMEQGQQGIVYLPVQIDARLFPFLPFPFPLFMGGTPGGLPGFPGLPGLPGLPNLPGLASALVSMDKPLILQTLLGQTTPTTTTTTRTTAATAFPTPPVTPAPGTVEACPLVCTTLGSTTTIDQLAQACAASCRGSITGQADDLAACLVACSQPSQERCKAYCVDPTIIAAARKPLCDAACNQLCQTVSAIAPLLTNPTCCVVPPATCGKGTNDEQVAACRNGCPTGNPNRLAICQTACTSPPSQACKGICARFIANVPDRTASQTACNSLCVAGSDTTVLAQGLSPSGRRYCSAGELPTCRVPGNALGLTRDAQLDRCVLSCGNAAFTTPENQGGCQACCRASPQSNCATCCVSIADAGDREKCTAACNNNCAA